MASCGADERTIKRLHGVLAPLEGLGAEFLNGSAHLECGGRGWHRPAEAHRNRIGNVPRHLPEESPALETEDAAPHSVEVDRDDRHVQALHDAFESPAEGQQLAGARDLAFCKDADNFPLAESIAGN